MGVEIILCVSDEEAMAEARTYCGRYRVVEVWELARRVGRVNILVSEQLLESHPANFPEASESGQSLFGQN